LFFGPGVKSLLFKGGTKNKTAGWNALLGLHFQAGALSGAPERSDGTPVEIPEEAGGIFRRERSLEHRSAAEVLQSKFQVRVPATVLAMARRLDAQTLPRLINKL